tara:strand:- start:5184 stop:6323 length:1140 start_codon:yes stop_codon:yes gene_type:complete
MINIFEPSFNNKELEAVENVFNSKWIGRGSKVKEFEKNFATHLGQDPKKLLSTTSCTEAIYLSTSIFNFTSQDEIIIPTISFPSIGSAVIESEANIVFCDVDKNSLNVNSEEIQKVITPNTKAIYITHYGGVPCDMDSIMKICVENNIYIIEDSACAISSTYKGKACGTLGDMGMWSFDAMKTLSTGDGGMIFFKENRKKIEAAESLYLGLPQKSTSGIDSAVSSNENWWEFEMNRPGRRAIMNDISASIGLAQLEKLNQFIKKREEIHFKYINSLQNIGDLILPTSPNFEYTSSYYFFWIQTRYRDDLAKFLYSKGIYSTFRYWPLHKIQMFSEFCKRRYDGANYASENTLNIPIHQNLSSSDVDLIIKTIKSFFEKR